MRRSIMVLGALAVTSFSFTTVARADDFELLHSWSVGPDAVAMDVVRRFAKEARLTWNEHVVDPPFMNLRAIYLDRAGAALPPTGVIWLSSGSGQNAEMAEYFRDITPELKPHLESYYPEAIEVVSHDGGIYAIPLTTEIANRLVINPQVLERLNLPVPQSWEEVIALGPKLEAAGISLMAQGQGDWLFALTFISILSSVAPPDAFEKLISGTLEEDQRRTYLGRSLTVMLDLARYSPLMGPDAGTFQQSEAVIAGDALLTFTGDWASPLFDDTSAQCQPPFDSRAVLVLTASIAFPQDVPGDQKALQDRFVEVLTKQEFREAFLKAKGSLSPGREIPSGALNACMQASIRDWQAAEQRINLEAALWLRQLIRSGALVKAAWRDQSANQDTYLEGLVHVFSRG